MTKEDIAPFYFIRLDHLKKKTLMELSLSKCLWRGAQDQALEIIKHHPELNLAWLTSDYRSTFLHAACYHNFHQIVSILLKVKGIDINHRNRNGITPFLFACISNSTESLVLLLNDPRLDLTSHDNADQHLLCQSHVRSRRLIPLWIASGRPIEPRSQIEETVTVLKTRIGRERDIELLESYLIHPQHAAFLASIMLGRSESLASQFFAPVVFLSDDLLQFTEEDDQKLDEQASKTVRFLKMARVLPIELQMLLCHRAVCSTKDNIPSNISELAFQKFAQAYTPTVCSCFS